MVTLNSAAFQLLKAERPPNKQQEKVAAVQAWKNISREGAPNLVMSRGSKLSFEPENKGALYKMLHGKGHIYV